MGLFKQVKDMKQMVAAAPEMMAAAQQAGLAAQQLAAAQAEQAQAAAAASAPAIPAPADLEPIAGVSLQVYAEISRGLSAHGYDTSKSFDLAAARGISRDDWQAAMDGWNARMAASPAVGRAFNDAYMGR
jgi:hypothetical protein